ncbi:hypothetical protein OH77DRAFT_1423344 [Trametes cingulata]|nr:hypothetical protein OH77DRAFT_1423344 [Trametes cingulata]
MHFGQNSERIPCTPFIIRLRARTSRRYRCFRISVSGRMTVAVLLLWTPIPDLEPTHSDSLRVSRSRKEAGSLAYRI